MVFEIHAAEKLAVQQASPQAFAAWGCAAPEIYFSFGRNPAMWSSASAIAGSNGGRHSAMALGLPGRFTIKVFPRTPAVARDKIAVRTLANETARITSPN